MWVPEQLQISNLSLYPPRHITIRQVLARNDLQRNMLAGHFVNRKFDLAKGTFADSFDNSILPKPRFWFVI